MKGETEMREEIKIVYGDLTTYSCDAIVNSANSSLLAGSGLCRSIHLMAGRNLESECLELGKCKVGEVRLTKSYELLEKDIAWIIHAVAPRWWGGNKSEVQQLEQVYKNCIEVAYNYASIYKEQMLYILTKYLEGEVFEESLEEIKRYIDEHPIKKIAFPAIGTGIYHFPLELSALVAKKAFNESIIKGGTIEKISIVCNDIEVYKTYKAIFEER